MAPRSEGEGENEVKCRHAENRVQTPPTSSPLCPDGNFRLFDLFPRKEEIKDPYIRAGVG